MIYLASPFLSDEQLNFVKEIEKALDNMNLEYFSPSS